MTIQKWLILAINTLLTIVVITLSVAFYFQFKKALDERVLLQLTSIKRLKKNQIEAYLKREWFQFESVAEYEITEISDSIKNKVINNRNYQATGAYDVTHLNTTGKLLIAFVFYRDTIQKIKLLNGDRIQDILLERTGLGDSGESYLVGNDYRLRSQSRFYTAKLPFDILAKTKGVLRVFSGKSGNSIFEDYRDVEVYSAYGSIDFLNLKFAILSEIDTEEVMAPLFHMQKRLVFIALLIVLVGVGISLYLSKIIAKPVVEMQNKLQSMASGNYEIPAGNRSKLREIQSMFMALSELQNSLKGAVNFSSKIGEMDLKHSYEPISSKDLLGYSLLKMRDNLIAFNEREASYNTLMKKSLIEREELERKRISMELHDGIGPLLTTLKMYMQNTIEDSVVKEEVKGLLDNTITEIRHITYALLPPTLIDFGLGYTLKSFVKNLKNNNKANIQFEDDTRNDTTRMSFDLQINLFRISQELLNNAIKHANAARINLTISEFEEYVSLFYFDDGVGYNTDQVNIGSGLLNIRERVEIFNGELLVHSEKNKTTVEIEIPIQNETN
ncbi:sensor histidine kinase [Flavicella sediminum]|uniref:sensor histidine kinase n=1 Tax=Flavicella sediminum TaxID=2585141 RepID=UPI0011237A7C|nr:ATP-binding protein [Flavicella sediminum]